MAVPARFRERLKTPKLPLTTDERQQLRPKGVRLVEFATQDPQSLAKTLNWPLPRVQLLCSLAQFQQLPDVGPATAGDLVLLGFAEPGDLVGQDANALYRRLQVLTNSKQDPCVEDVFNSVIYHVSAGENDPVKTWADWSRERLVR